MSENCLICPSNFYIFVDNFVLVFYISYHEPGVCGKLVEFTPDGNRKSP